MNFYEASEDLLEIWLVYGVTMGCTWSNSSCWADNEADCLSCLHASKRHWQISRNLSQELNSYRMRLNTLRRRLRDVMLKAANNKNQTLQILLLYYSAILWLNCSAVYFTQHCSLVFCRAEWLYRLLHLILWCLKMSVWLNEMLNR